MDASKYQFDDDKISTLHNHRDNQPDARLKVRFIALLMLAEGLELEKIAPICTSARKNGQKKVLIPPHLLVDFGDPA